MMDPHRITQAPQASPGVAQPSTGSGIIRPVLWLLLVICAVGNIVTSNTGVNMAVGLAFGLATLGLATALVVHHYRNRRR
jgi:hypothetical protein